MNEAEFLKSWPSLVPAVWRLVNAAVARSPEASLLDTCAVCGHCLAKHSGDCDYCPGANTTFRIELSQAAKDAAEAEISIWLSAGDACDNGFHVQRAMDAAVLGERARFTKVTVDEQSLAGVRIEYRPSDGRFYAYLEGDFLWSGDATFNVWRCVVLTAEVARLTKELAEEQEISAAEVQKSNVTESNLREALEELAEERDRRETIYRVAMSNAEETEGLLDAAQSALERAHENGSGLLRAAIAELNELRSAIAEKEKELAEVRENAQCAICSLRETTDLAAKMLAASLKQARSELSAERAAREKVEAGLRAITAAVKASDSMYEEWEAMRNANSALRAQLQQAEQERDEAKKWADKCQASSSQWQDNHAKELAQNASLRAELAAMTKQRDAAEEGLRGCCLVLGFDPSDGEGTSPDEVVAFVRDALDAEKLSVSSIKTELAATQETCRRAENNARYYQNHRNALQKQNTGLMKERERDELARKLPVISQRIAVVVEAAFREGYMSRAGTIPTQWIDVPWSISASKAALNQSPE